MENLFLTILSISLTISVIIIILIVLGSLLNKRYVAKWKYGLWIALALRLLVPVNYTVPDSDFQITVPDEVGKLTVSNIFDTEDEVAEEQPADSEMVEAQTIEPQMVIPLPVEVDIQKKARSSFSLMQALSYLWIVGAVCLLIWQLTGFFYYKRKILKRGKQAENSTLSEQMFELRKELNINKDVELLIYENVSSPMIIGFWRPVLVLPEDEYTANESYYILKHELIHLRRHDVLVKFLLMLSRDIHWFNPIVWMMHKEAVIDMELACDEAVVRGASFDQREAYTETLLSVLHGAQHRGPLLSTQFSGGVRIMKKRFRNILSKANKKNGIILFSLILIMTMVIGTMVGCSMEQPISDTSEEMDVDTDELVINTQLLQYMNMTYAQFKEQVGTEAEFYHGLYFQAPIPDKGANAVFLGSYDDEVAGSVLSDEDKSFRVESILSNIISGITGEMTVTEFVEMLGSHAVFAYEIHHEIQEGLTAYYVAYHYVEMKIDSNGDDTFDIQLNIALDEADYITPYASTWIYESAFFEDSVEDDNDETSDGLRFSEQDAELIDMGIHNNEHNIYMGSIVKEEMRMIITRTDDSLSAAYITRGDKEKIFKGELKKDSAGFILKTDAGEYLEGSIRAEDNGEVFIYGQGVISGNEVAFTLSQNTFFPIDEDTENYYSSLGYDAKAVERFAKQIKDSINDKTAFAKLISYPISIEIDGSDISIENEEEMLDVHDKLMEQKGFKQQIESIYTKYMFANYMGICVEDGIMWIQQDSSGDYKIYAINVPKNNKEVEDIVSAFASAFFTADTDAIQKYLVDPYEWTIDVYDNPEQADKVNIIGIKGIPGNLAGNVGDECVASLEFSNPGEDSLTYLTIKLVKDEESWKVKFYGLEK